MTRAEIIARNLETVEEGISRIKKLLPKLDHDLPNSVVVYSRMALRNVRNIEVDVSGKSQIDVDKLYKVESNAG